MSRPTHPYRRRLWRNTLVTGATGGWAVLLAAAVVPVLLAELGTDQFGLWALLWSFSAVNGWPSVATVGLGIACTRRVAAAEVAGRPTDAAGVVTLFTLVGMAAGLAMATIGSIALPALVSTSDSLQTTLIESTRWAGLWIAGEAAIVGCSALLEGRQRVDLARGLDAARRTVVTGAAVVAAIATGDLTAVMAASALAAAGVAAVALLAILVSAPDFRPLGRPAATRALLADAASLTTLNASGVLHRSMDRLLVAAMIGPAAVAAVEVASRLRDIAQLVLSTSSYTTISAASWLDAQREPAKLHQLVTVGSRLSLLATWTAVAALAVYADPLLEVWLGARLPADTAELALLGLAYTAVMAPIQVGVNALTGTGRVGPLARAAWLGVMINLAASIILIDRIGVAGAFVGTLIGSAVVLPLLTPLVLDISGLTRRTAVTDVIAPVLPPAALVLATGLVVGGAGWPAAITLVIGGLLSLAVAVPAALRWSMTAEDFEGLRGDEPVAAAR